MNAVSNEQVRQHDEFRQTGHRLTNASNIRRIGLISPCSGNLGNAAILTAVIDNIRARLPQAEIVGITLSPEDTRRRHGIAGFPITDTARENYYTPPGTSGTGVGVKAYAPPSRFRQRLKKIPLLRGGLRGIKTARTELMHGLRAAKLVRSLDLVMIPGGGALDEFWGGPWGHPWTLLKFALLGRAFRVPLYFVSVGKCALESPLSRFFARTALRLSKYRSYRDHDSKQSVQSVFRSPNDPVIPDLGYSYLVKDADMAEVDARPLIGVSPIAYGDPRIWPVKDGPLFMRYMAAMESMLKQLLQRGYRVLLFSTDSPDNAVIDDLLKTLAGQGVDTSAIETTAGPPEQTTEGLLHGLMRTRAVIASRLHGIILSHLIAKPVLAVSYDRKVDAHMHEIGQAEFRVDIHDTTADELLQRFDRLCRSMDCISARLRKQAETNKAQLEEQYDTIFGTVRLDRANMTANEELLKPLQC